MAASSATPKRIGSAAPAVAGEVSASSATAIATRSPRTQRTLPSQAGSVSSPLLDGTPVGGAAAPRGAPPRRPPAPADATAARPREAPPARAPAGRRPLAKGRRAGHAQRVQLLGRERAAGTRGVEPRPPQRLVGQQVANA